MGLFIKLNKNSYASIQSSVQFLHNCLIISSYIQQFIGQHV